MSNITKYYVTVTDYILVNITLTDLFREKVASVAQSLARQRRATTQEPLPKAVSVIRKQAHACDLEGIVLVVLGFRPG